MAHDLVAAASTATAKDEAAAALAAFLDKRVDEVREELDGDA